MKQKMRTFVLNKIVRDGIVPSNDEIGAVTKWRVLQGEELVAAAREKVKEETQELFADKEISIGEFADSIEALFFMARVYGYKKDEVLAAMQKRQIASGHLPKIYT